MFNLGKTKGMLVLKSDDSIAMLYCMEYAFSCLLTKNSMTHSTELCFAILLQRGGVGDSIIIHGTRLNFFSKHILIFLKNDYIVNLY